MAYLSRSRPDSARQRAQYRAFLNRQEIIKAGLSRRDLFKMGLLTGAGMLVARDGLSARAASAAGTTAGQCASPPTTPFTINLPIPPVKQAVASLSPTPTVAPNPAAGEGRTRNHQAPNVGLPFPPPVLYQVTQQAGSVIMSNQLPPQTIWGYDGITPGPTFVAHYNTPILVRQVNNLPANNGGFGLNSVSTHLHGGHTPSESDGFPCDFFEAGHFYDQYYANKYAGFNSTNKPNGDINEAQSTLFYHDHRIDFTAQNVYKGLAGFYLLFNEFDTGNEATGFRLPTFPDFDIPMMFADKCFDPTTALLAFDLFNLDGILGDKFTVNGVIQPVLHVRPRRYRFRWVNAGPSRFLQLYLTDLINLTANNQFWQISNDGNLLPTPIQVPAVAFGVAERADVIIDFAPFAGKTLYIENRLDQTDGNGPSGNLFAAGQGNLLLKIVVDQPAVADNSVNPVGDQRPPLRLQHGALHDDPECRRALGVPGRVRLEPPDPHPRRGVPDPERRARPLRERRHEKVLVQHLEPVDRREPRAQGRGAAHPQRGRDRVLPVAGLSRPLSPALPQRHPRGPRDDAALRRRDRGRHQLPALTGARQERRTCQA